MQPDTLLSTWRRAERQLYPLALSAPDTYERAVTLVRSVADELRAVDRIEELAAWFGRRHELVADALKTTGIEASDLDHDALAGAAFSLRHHELAAATEQAAALERLVAARGAGKTWATLHQSGTTWDDGTVFPPYDLVEASTSGSYGLHAWAELGIDSDAVVYGVEAVCIDPATATWWNDATSPATEHADVASWRAAQADLRHRLDTS